jgi:hypothetical protein
MLDLMKCVLSYSCKENEFLVADLKGVEVLDQWDFRMLKADEYVQLLPIFCASPAFLHLIEDIEKIRDLPAEEFKTLTLAYNQAIAKNVENCILAFMAGFKNAAINNGAENLEH